MSETSTFPPPLETSIPTANTFCNYLARQFVSKKGFGLGTVPEAQKLVAASDTVLTLYDGVPFTVLCLIDRDANPGKTFDLPLSELQAIALSCRKYSASLSPLGSTKMPIVIRVIEVGPTSDERWRQLEAISSSLFAMKYQISALAGVRADSAGGRVDRAGSPA